MARRVLVVRSSSAAVVGLVVVAEDVGLLQRQQRLVANLLGQRRDVAVVEDLDAVDLAVDVGGDQAVGDLARVGEGGRSVKPVQVPPSSQLAELSEETPRRPTAYQSTSLPSSSQLAQRGGCPRG